MSDPRESGRKRKPRPVGGWILLEAEAQRRREGEQLELDENVQRVDLDSYEAGKQRMREIEKAEQQARAEVEFRTDSVQKSRGQPKRPDSSREVAKRTGIPAQTIRDTKRHVSTAEV